MTTILLRDAVATAGGRPLARSAAGNRAQGPVLDELLESPTRMKLDLSIPDGTHGAFADYQWLVPAIAAAFDLPAETVTDQLGTADPAGSVRAQRAYVGAFFDQFLRGRSPTPAAQPLSPLSRGDLHP